MCWALGKLQTILSGHQEADVAVAETAQLPPGAVHLWQPPDLDVLAAKNQELVVWDPAKLHSTNDILRTVDWPHSLRPIAGNNEPMGALNPTFAPLLTHSEWHGSSGKGHVAGACCFDTLPSDLQLVL